MVDFQRIDGLEGFKPILESVKKIKEHKQTYSIFEVSKLDPVSFNILSEGGKDSSFDSTYIATKSELEEIFNTCRQQIDLSMSYFIAYDFAYHNSKNKYRERVILIYYLGEKTNIRQKVIMATNMQKFLYALNIGVVIQVQNPEEMNYDYIKNECEKI